MNEPARYTPYHPRWLRSTVSTYWWLERRPYFLFILREISSVFVAWFVVSTTFPGPAATILIDPLFHPVFTPFRPLTLRSANATLCLFLKQDGQSGVKGCD